MEEKRGIRNEKNEIDWEQEDIQRKLRKRGEKKYVWK